MSIVMLYIGLPYYAEKLCDETAFVQQIAWLTKVEHPYFTEQIMCLSAVKSFFFLSPIISVPSLLLYLKEQQV